MPSRTRPAKPDQRERTDRPDPRRSARRAGLRYGVDDRPGIARRRAGRGFSYRAPDGQPVRDEATLARIRALAVPPAWTEVWISTDADTHLQATGRDARGRKQYRYHPRWRSRRDDAKFERIVAFAALLPRIRRRVDRDLARRSLDREKVLAAVIRLLELTLIRVGNDEYARLNHSFGLTTLKDRHAVVRGPTVRFRFRGKSGRRHEVDIRDRRLARIVRRCQELPGQELFQYLDREGRPEDVTSDDVNAYLRSAAGADVTTRDFRIWAGTVAAYRALRALDGEDRSRSARQVVVEAVRIAADALGNTAAVARASYVHPRVLAAYLDGTMDPPRRRSAPAPDDATPALADPAAEAAVLELLRGPLEREASRSTHPGSARSSTASSRRPSD
jgi:DNA topoisomerase-1